MPSLNMLDIAKQSGNDRVVGLIEENLTAVPELSVIDTRTIKGTSFKAGYRTAYPAGAFRKAGGGSSIVKGAFGQKNFECFDYGLPVQVSRSIALAHEDGAAAALAIESVGAGQGAMADIGRQIFYGTDSSTGGADLGFQGYKQHTPLGNKTARGDDLVVNAGGSTANTASSVYLVKFGVQASQLIFGQGAGLDLPDFTQQMVNDVDGKSFMAYVSELQAWAGLAVYNENAVRRIANLTAQAGKGLTDALLADALASCPAGMLPDQIFMSRRSRSQLQKSRSVVLQGSGSSRPNQPTIAPTPTEYEGIPIVITESIGNTDAIEVAE